MNDTSNDNDKNKTRLLCVVDAPDKLIGRSAVGVMWTPRGNVLQGATLLGSTVTGGLGEAFSGNDALALARRVMVGRGKLGATTLTLWRLAVATLALEAMLIRSEAVIAATLLARLEEAPPEPPGAQP